MEPRELTAAVTIASPPEAAFDLFTLRFGDWWPREFSWSGESALQRIGIEPRVEGALYEIGPHGLRWDWGRVLDWRPPEQLTFTWQIGPDRVPVPDPASASRVRATFTRTGSGDDPATAVSVEHGDWDRHGAEGEAYRAAFEQVWPYALGRLAVLTG